MTKKLHAVSKTEATITESGGLSLDALLEKRKINADQKAQIQKKPQLEAQLSQLEEQQKNYTELIQDLEARFEQEKSSLVESHNAEIEKVREEATHSSTTASTSKVKDALQVACQFLHAAAYQRQREDVGENEKQAYEAVLFHLYQGNSSALDTLVSVVEGTEVNVSDPSGDPIEYTFAQLKLSALATLNNDDQVAAEADDEPETETTPAIASGETDTDPTIANAGLTELEDTTTIPIVDSENVITEDGASAVPEQALAAADVGNAAAEAAWNPEASMTTDATENGEGWVQVQNPAETETGSAPEPAAPQSTTNWADEAGAAAEEQATTPLAENDGFSEVRRDRGGRGRGGRGGRGFDSRGRGRGGRGDFRGRGRGGNRGAPRGAPAPVS